MMFKSCSRRSQFGKGYWVVGTRSTGCLATSSNRQAGTSHSSPGNTALCSVVPACSRYWLRQQEVSVLMLTVVQIRMSGEESVGGTPDIVDRWMGGMKVMCLIGQDGE